MVWVHCPSILGSLLCVSLTPLGDSLTLGFCWYSWRGYTGECVRGNGAGNDKIIRKREEKARGEGALRERGTFYGQLPGRTLRI